MATFNVNLALLLACSVLPVVVLAETTAEPVQTLDSVSVSSSAPNKALEMGFDDPLVRNPDFKAYAAASTSGGFKSCQKTSSRGLFCLDGKVVKNWSNLADTSAETLFSCEDAALGLDKRSDTCTSLSVNLAGEIWLAGKEGSAYTLIKVVRKPDAGCATGFSGLTASPNYCFRKAYRGRPLLLDIQAIDGEFADRFTYGAGVLGLERREDLVFFPDAIGGTPVLIANKSGWGLSGNESLQSGSVVQRLDLGYTDNFALVTTGTGKVLAKYLPFTGTSTAFYTGYTIPAERLLPLPASPACNGTAGYQVRGSGTSGLVYVADRAVCQVAALQPTYPYTAGDPLATPTLTLNNVQVGTPPKDFTLSTRSTLASASYPPDSIAISPGIDISFADCSNGKTCPWIPDNNDGNAYNGAEMSGVVYTGPDNMALFQVKNIPDCRYINPAICQQLDTVITDDRGKKYLNVTPLLPAEIQRLFPNGQGPAPDQLPQLLISEEYQARASRPTPYTFDAFFGVTDPAIRFRDNFTLQFDIAQLTNDVTRCGTDYGNAPYDWDLVLTVSERFPTVGGPTGQANTPYTPTRPNGDVTGDDREHTEMLLNTGCFNPTSTTRTGTRISLYAYGMQPKPSPKPDRTYTDLVAKLFYDLIDTQNRLACAADVDSELVGGTAGNPPLRKATCDSLFTRWDLARLKLEDCFLATKDPKSSAGDQNCGAFDAQMKNYIAGVEGAARWGDDPANRIGELASRGRVILHVFNDHFLKTIPANGVPAP